MTVRYGAGDMLLDIHPAGGPTVLLWHGRGRSQREVLAPLAEAVAALGTTVLVPDWRPDLPDGGWGDLRASVRFARWYAGDGLTLAGWSLGARAAVSAALRPELLDGWRPAAVVGIASNYLRAENAWGLPAPVDALDGAAPLPVRLVHGTADRVADPRGSRTLHALLRERGWPASLTELPADHAGVVGTRYDPGRGRCLPSDAPDRTAARDRTARVIAGDQQ